MDVEIKLPESIERMRCELAGTDVDAASWGVMGAVGGLLVGAFGGFESMTAFILVGFVVAYGLGCIIEARRR